MYQLLVFYPEDRAPRAMIAMAKASDVLLRVSALLSEHHGCERVVVMMDRARLFAVDCKGNRLP